MVSAILRNTLAFPQVSSQMRRLFGPCGYASRRRIWIRCPKGRISRPGRPIAKPNELGRRWGARGIANRLREEGAPEMPLVGTLGNAIAVTRVTVSTTTLLSVRKKEIGMAALLRHCDQARNLPENPTPLLLWKLQLTLEVRRSRPPLGRPARRNNHSLRQLNWAGNLQ